MAMATKPKKIVHSYICCLFSVSFIIIFTASRFPFPYSHFFICPLSCLSPSRCSVDRPTGTAARKLSVLITTDGQKRKRRRRREAEYDMHMTDTRACFNLPDYSPFTLHSGHAASSHTLSHSSSLAQKPLPSISVYLRSVGVRQQHLSSSY